MGKLFTFQIYVLFSVGEIRRFGELFTFQIHVLFSVFIYFLNKTKQKEEMKEKKPTLCASVVFNNKKIIYLQSMEVDVV